MFHSGMLDGVCAIYGLLRYPGYIGRSKYNRASNKCMLSVDYREATFSEDLLLTHES